MSKGSQVQTAFLGYTPKQKTRASRSIPRHSLVCMDYLALAGRSFPGTRGERTKRAAITFELEHW